MAINPIGQPIALQIRPLDLLRAEQVKGARLENEAFAQDQQRKNALASFYQQNGVGLYKGDPNALEDLAGIDPRAAVDFRTAQTETQKREYETNMSRLKAVANGLDAILNVPEGPGRQATQTLLYEQQKKYLAGLGIAMDDAPDLWDEDWARSVRATTETAQERLERMQSDPNYIGRKAEAEAQAKARAQQLYPQAREAPAGYRYGPDGSLTFIPGGPADPKTIQQGAETRREVIINNPLPNQGGPAGGRTITERMQNIVLNGDPTSPEYAAAYAYLAKPRIVFDPNTGETIQIAPDMSWARKPGSSGGGGAMSGGGSRAVGDLQPIPGAGAGEGRPDITRGPGRSASPTQATFQANVQQAQSDIAKAEAMLFPGAKYEGGSLKGGQFARGTAATGGINIPFAGQGLPFSEGREARQAVRRAVEIILRLRTGAAAPDAEVDNYVNLYAPSPADSEASARTKMERLRQFFEAEKSAASSKLPQTGSGFTVTPAAPANSGWSVQRVP